MALYHLDYDLHRERDYDKLYTELHRFRARHIALSKWEFDSPASNCDRLLAHFSRFVDGDDTIIVSEILKSVSSPPVNLLGYAGNSKVADALRRFSKFR